MKTIETINQGDDQAIMEGGLHQHSCCYCRQDFACKGEHCKPSYLQMCEECEQVNMHNLAAICPTASNEQIRRYEQHVRDSVSIGVSPLSFGMWMALGEVHWLRR